jgi:hypothetical protein
MSVQSKRFILGVDINHSSCSMPLLPLEALVNDVAQIRLIASDVDGTLTCADKFTPRLLEAIAQLTQANLPLLLVQDAPQAGWMPYGITCPWWGRSPKMVASSFPK